MYTHFIHLFIHSLSTVYYLAPSIEPFSSGKLSESLFVKSEKMASTIVKQILP